MSESNAAKVIVQDRADQLRLVEAIIFATAELVEEKTLRGFFDEDTDIKSLLEELKETYAGRGVELVRRGSAWGFRTAPDLAERLESRQVITKPLSKTATEVLAIIAYHQPVTRAEIEQIRGVSLSKSTMDILIGENWIRPGKRRQVPGKPLTWITTKHFLDYFGLEELSELPNMKELREAGFLEKQYQPEIHGVMGGVMGQPVSEGNTDAGDEAFNDDDIQGEDEE